LVVKKTENRRDSFGRLGQSVDKGAADAAEAAKKKVKNG
jgi:hypothetical protein